MIMDNMFTFIIMQITNHLNSLIFCMFTLPHASSKRRCLAYIFDIVFLMYLLSSFPNLLESQQMEGGNIIVMYININISLDLYNI